MDSEQSDEKSIETACEQFLSNVPDNLNCITPAVLREMLQADPESVFVLDNRTSEDFERCHISGAVNIWMGDIVEAHRRGNIPKDRAVVVCCWVGHSANQVMTVLKLLGYKALVLKYGMGVPRNPAEPRAGWLDVQYPTCSNTHQSEQVRAEGT